MEQDPIPLEAIDEAFANLPRQLHPDQRQDHAPKALSAAHVAGPVASRHFTSHAADDDAMSFVPHPAEPRTPRTASRAARLSAELHELDRQRERLAGLLRQISSHIDA